MEDFEKLRKKYNCFIFDDYKIMQEDNDTIERTKFLFCSIVCISANPPSLDFAHE